MTASLPHAKPPIGPGPSLASLATTVGVVAVGAAAFEAALVPGILLGAAAVFAPDLAARGLPRLRRGLRALRQSPGDPVTTSVSPRPVVAPPRFAAEVLPRLRIGQALAKTITFRITVATLDFAWGYAFLGEIATAAGLSAVNLVAGPFFYFLHEAAWNLYASPPVALPSADQPGPVVHVRGFKVTRALAKTIVYETFGTTAEFTVNFVVVGDPVTAAILTAPFAIFGPFIYLGHEQVWDYFAERAPRAAAPDPLPAW